MSALSLPRRLQEEREGATRLGRWRVLSHIMMAIKIRNVSCLVAINKHFALCILRFAAKKQICLCLIKITNAVRKDLQWFTVRHTKSRRFLEPTDYGLITLDKSGLGGKTRVMYFCSAMFFPFEILKATEQIGFSCRSWGRLGYTHRTIPYRHTQTHKTLMGK